MAITIQKAKRRSDEEAMVELHEISVAIGELRADAKSTRETLNRVEDRLDQIGKHLHTMPSPPACISKHGEIDREIRDLRIDNAKHATIISGIVAGVILFGKQLLTFLGVVPAR